MKNELVHQIKNDFFTNTLIVAENLEVKHADLLRTVKTTIDKLEKQNSLLLKLIMAKKRLQKAIELIDEGNHHRAAAALLADISLLRGTLKRSNKPQPCNQ